MITSQAPDKTRILDSLTALLSAELDAILRSAKTAHEAATHPDNRPEHQFDTRGLMDAYLAGAQAARGADLEKQLTVFRTLKPRAFAPGDPVSVGALVEVDAEGRNVKYFLVPSGGGLTLSIDGASIQVVTPQSPLGDALVGRRAGDLVELVIQGKRKEFELLAVS